MTRSPQHDVIDEILWSRTSGFWSKRMDPSDRDALTAIFEGYLLGLEGDYIRLHEINQAKSIVTCPVFSQRRWLRLDLNRYEELRSWLAFLSTGAYGLANTSSTGKPNDQVTCLELPTNHAKHWHIHFPLVVSEDKPDPDRRTVQLRYPIVSSLLEVYRMTSGRGTRLLPGRDFKVLDDGTSFRIEKAIPGETFEIQAGFDLSSENFAGFRPVVLHATTFLSNNVVQIPAEMHTMFPIHGLILRNVPTGTTSFFSQTNNSAYTMGREFIPYTGDASTGIQYGSLGQVVLPVGTALGPHDRLLLFILEPGEFDRLHMHTQELLVLDAGNANPGGTTSFTLPSQIPFGAFNECGIFGQEFQLFVDGELMPIGDYRYDIATNVVELRVPLSFRVRASIVVQYESQIKATPGTVSAYHLHHECWLQNTTTATELERFDDGGEYDDEEFEAMPFFDTLATSNVVYINLEADLPSMEVYVDGKLRRPGVDFSPSHEEGRTRVAFRFSVEGKSIQIVFQQVSSIYLYGGNDFLGGRLGNFGFSLETLSGALSDLDNLVSSFQASFGSTITNLSALIEAAYVAARGGDPFLTLFYDEFPEYGGLPIDAANQPMTAAEARNVESQNTKLISIPYITDHVKDPTIRLQEGIDYTVRSGGISSMVDLLAKRGDNDEEPGVWWCPVVLLDEHLLSKNFGALLGDVRDSSEAYRNALNANLMLRYVGPTAANVAKATAVMLGTPMFTQDSVVRNIFDRIVGWTVTAVSDSGAQQVVYSLSTQSPLPVVGQDIVPGQSIAAPLIYDGVLTNLISWTGGALTIDEDLVTVQAQDRLMVEVFDPSTPAVGRQWAFFTVTGVATSPTATGVRTVITLDAQSPLQVDVESKMRVMRDYGPPYAAFNGRISSVEAKTEKVVATDLEQLVVDPRRPLYRKPGDVVVRGDPVHADLTAFYDDTIRQNWHWLKPADFSLNWAHLLPANRRSLRADGQEDRRLVTILAGASGYGVCSLNPIDPLPPRGTQLTIADETFTVVGKVGARVLVHPDPGHTIEGEGVFTIPETTSSLRAREYFEYAVVGMQSILRYAQKVGSPTLTVQDGQAFPAAGAVVLPLAHGGSIEVSYFSREGNVLYDLAWPSSFDSLEDEDGVVHPMLEAGNPVQVILEYQDKVLNPAFTALVRTRTQRDFSTVSGMATVSETDADEFYALLKASSSVLETKAVNRPTALLDALADVLPPGSTVVVRSKHVVVDEFSAAVMETAPMEDRVFAHGSIDVSIESPDGTVVDDRLSLLATAQECVVQAVVLDPGGGTSTYAWSIRAIRGGSLALQVLDPTGPSTRIEGLLGGGEYYVTVEVTSSLGYKRSATVVIAVGG